MLVLWSLLCPHSGNTLQEESQYFYKEIRKKVTALSVLLMQQTYAKQEPRQPIGEASNNNSGIAGRQGKA